jgi:hypothetical protein
LLHSTSLYIKSFDKESHFGRKRNLWSLGTTVHSWYKLAINKLEKALSLENALGEVNKKATTSEESSSESTNNND